MTEAEKKLREIFGEDVSTSIDDRPERPINTQPLFPLRDVWPDAITVLERLLTEAGELALAASLTQLDVVDRCRCGQIDCATVYTRSTPVTGIRHQHRNIAFFPPDTMCLDRDDKLQPMSQDWPTAPYLTVLDVVGEQIACIEILGDEALASALAAALPD